MPDAASFSPLTFARPLLSLAAGPCDPGEERPIGCSGTRRPLYSRVHLSGMPPRACHRNDRGTPTPCDTHLVCRTRPALHDQIRLPQAAEDLPALLVVDPGKHGHPRIACAEPAGQQVIEVFRKSQVPPLTGE